MAYSDDGTIENIYIPLTYSFNCNPHVIMDNLDQDSENNAKVSDSAYSNSCSNSQSRRSHSSKSTHSGSHSSRSSGYGGKTSSKTFSDNSGQPEEKRCKEKEVKQKKLVRLENTAELEGDTEDPAEHTVVQEVIQEKADNAVEHMPSPQLAKADILTEIVESASPDASSNNEEVSQANLQLKAAMVPLDTTTICTFTGTPTPDPDGGFSCVISMHDGVVMYTTSSLTSCLGFPKDMWIGRSFIDFVHARDRNTFASHITSGLSVPKNVNVSSSQNAVGSMVCRIRKYRTLSGGFGVKEKTVSYMPFFLKLTFKNISDTEGKVTYLVIQATPFYSAFKTPNEVIAKATSFVIRHAANGNVEYIDPEAVQYLGFLPQDLEGKDALQLYHMDDLPYLRLVYETIVREGGVVKSKPYRIMTQNWDFIKVETEWSSFINPWSKKLEFVISKHNLCLV
ncbi:PAS domain-containing protein [Phthorimaea operculella]|nr:PAS domain-containing protein [Phthorimaea operculella]